MKTTMRNLILQQVLVTGVEVAETNTSFLASRDTWWRNVPSGNSCNTRLGDIFHFFLDGAGVDTFGREVVATTTPLAPAPRTSLLVLLVFLDSLALMVGRLVLATRYVSGRGVSGLRPSGVLFLFLGGPVPSGTPGIYLADT